MKKILILLGFLLFVNLSFSQKILYKVKNDKIYSISRVSDNYFLSDNEYSSTVWYQKPFFNGTTVIESITQTEINAIKDLKTENDLLETIRKELQDGIEASERLVLYIRQLGLTPSQLLTAKKVLLPIYKALRDGNWDIAQEEMNVISRPTGDFGVVYDRIKAYIDDYINN